MEEECYLDSKYKSGDATHFSELRILLLGNKAAGKSSSANTIFSGQEFGVKTAQCVKHCGEVAGRQVTVVEAPGWWRNYLIKDTPALQREEIVLSVSLCPPGPHAVLIAVRLDSDFTDIHRRALEERVELLGERVWSHAILLFTHGDSLNETSIRQHIRKEGSALEWLIAKCGNRHHVLDNTNRKNNKQVMELLWKIEEMVSGNNGCHFAVDDMILHEIKIKRKIEEKSAKQRLMSVEKQTQNITSLTGQIQSQMRIVLVGHRFSGKSSAGNTILGRQRFDLHRCSEGVMRQGDVAGRKVTVVEAPGWWNNYFLKDSPELTKQEFVLSVSLCPPGPHVLLVAIRVDGSFTERNRRAIKQHLELLTERVWSYTMVLFTYGDWLGNTTVEQHIESEGQALKRLLEKCENRYHVFNNTDKSNETQVTDLLVKIEKMVSRNCGQHFKFDQVVLQQIEEKKRKSQECAKQRIIKVKNKRETLRILMGHTHFLSELRIVLLGFKYSGKSSAQNTILGNEDIDTRSVPKYMGCKREMGKRCVSVVDTPGWERTCPVELASTKHEFILSVTLCPPRPHVLLLVIQADTSFTEKDRRATEEHMELFGERVWNHTIVLFTCGDWLGDTDIEQHIESEGRNLQWLVEACRNRYHVLNNMIKGEEAQIIELLEKIEEIATESGHLSASIMDRLPEEGSITDHTKKIHPCSVKTNIRKLPDLELKGDQSMHYPPTMGMYDSSAPGSDSDYQTSSYGYSLIGSVDSSLSSGIGSLNQSGLKTQKLFKTASEEDNYKVSSKKNRGELLDELD